MKIHPRLGLALLAVAALCDAVLRWPAAPSPVPLAVVPPTLSPTLTCGDYRVVQQGLIPMPAGVAAAHASSLVAMPAAHPWYAQKTLTAFWFAGTRESAADVQIAAATFDRHTQTWDAPRWVVNRDMLAQSLGVQIRRIGNPVAWADDQGRLHLFVVATGLGGWAASRVVHLREEAPLQFKAQRILPVMPLVPLFNTSALVRTVPLPLADAGAVLPMYFEIGVKYALALRLNAQGEMQSLTRITQRRDVLQPSLVAHTPNHWSALMRAGGPQGHVAHTQTWDGGQHWQDAPDLTLSNPDASVAALRLSTGGLMLAHNPAERRREVLLRSTAASAEFAWTTQPVVEGGAAQEYSYPTLVEVPASNAPAGALPDVWLSYTHQRKAIAFQQLRPACAPARSQP